MPFGQSIVARIGTKAALASIGCDPITQAIASRVVGWTVAHLTLDHHHQVIAEVGDAAHDGYNVADSASDFHDSSNFHDTSNLQRSGRVYGYIDTMNNDVHNDVDDNFISKPFKSGEHVHVAEMHQSHYMVAPPSDSPKDYVWVQHIDENGHTQGYPSRLPLSDLKPWTQSSPPISPPRNV